MNKVLTGNSIDVLKTLDDNSIDAVITDPPYGYSFMGKDWDKAVPSVEIWQECLRVLKPGAFCMVMSAPRSDVQMHMISNLEQAGFRIDFTPIYWTYASGFPKAGNIGKMVDKRNGKPQRHEEFEQYLYNAIKSKYSNHRVLAQDMGVDESLIRHWNGKHGQALIPTKAQYAILKEKLELDDTYDELINWEAARREVIGKGKAGLTKGDTLTFAGNIEFDITAAKTSEAKALDGSYAGFQPKPAVEVIIVAMKPLSEKTFVDQALKNGKGITWLDDCRIPYRDEADKGSATPQGKVTSNIAAGARPDVDNEGRNEVERPELLGRFPANILECDNILSEHGRYFDLDKWANTLPFLITPKASTKEKDKGVEHMAEKQWRGDYKDSSQLGIMDLGNSPRQKAKNNHPTVKPLKLMSYLITLTTREGDTVLDPFCGSGTTCIAAKLLKRKYVGIEREQEYVEIAEARLKAHEPDPQLELLDVR